MDAMSRYYDWIQRWFGLDSTSTATVWNDVIGVIISNRHHALRHMSLLTPTPFGFECPKLLDIPPEKRKALDELYSSARSLARTLSGDQIPTARMYGIGPSEQDITKASLVLGSSATLIGPMLEQTSGDWDCVENKKGATGVSTFLERIHHSLHNVENMQALLIQGADFHDFRTKLFSAVKAAESYSRGSDRTLDAFWDDIPTSDAIPVVLHAGLTEGETHAVNLKGREMSLQARMAMETIRDVLRTVEGGALRTLRTVEGGALETEKGLLVTHPRVSAQLRILAEVRIVLLCTIFFLIRLLRRWPQLCSKVSALCLDNLWTLIPNQT